MASVIQTAEWTAADLVDAFGPISIKRIRHDPAPGTATEDDVVAIWEHEKRLYELVDGILVEKTVGIQESYLAVLIARLIGNFIDQHGLGVVLGADGMARLFPGRVRIPDVSFISWERFPDRKIPAKAFVEVGLDLVVEVLSASNTVKEMDGKLRDYFKAEVRLVWYVDAVQETIQVFRSLEDSVMLRAGDRLDGGDVLPGFSLEIDDLFSNLAK